VLRLERPVERHGHSDTTLRRLGRFSAVVAAEELSLISYERSEREMYVGGIVGVLLIVLLVILILRLA
jgi:hypothetical protein